MASAQLAEHLWPTEEDPTMKISQYPLQAAKRLMPGQRVTGKITLPQSARVVPIGAPGAGPGDSTMRGKTMWCSAGVSRSSATALLQFKTHNKRGRIDPAPLSCLVRCQNL